MLVGGSQVTAKPGSAGAVAARATEVRQAMANATGQPWYAWAAVAGLPSGSFAATSRFEGLEGLAAAQEKLSVDATYQKLAAELAPLLTGPAETSLDEVIAVYGDIAEPKQVLSVTRATLANSGSVADAIGWAGRIMEHVHQATGMTGFVATSAAGDLFRVSWIGQTDTFAEADVALAALAADPAYMALLDEGAPFVIEGSVNRAVAVQIG